MESDPLAPGAGTPGGPGAPGGPTTYPPQQPPPYTPSPGYQSVPKGGAPGVHHVTLIDEMDVDDYRDPYPSMTCLMLLSCLVFWCFSPILGLAAFIVACVGQSSQSKEEVRQLKTVSMVLSIIGILLTLLVGMIALIFYLTIGFGPHPQPMTVP